MLYCGANSLDAHLSQNDQHNAQPTQAWKTYWQGAGDAGAISPDCVRHPAFPKFWSVALGEFIADRPDGRLLDIATGGGAVIDYFSHVPNAKLENVSCVDVSKAAIDAVQGQFPDVSCIVADAKSIPLESGRYDLLTSQFGIEYAGLAAIDEASRLLASKGSLLFLMHIRPGELYRECGATIDALRRTKRSGFVQLALDFFDKGFAAVRGADRAPYDSAARRLNPAIRELESIVSEHGEHVAGDMIVHLHTTVQTIHQRIQYYDPDEALSWLRKIDRELAMYEERMVSMHDSTLDEEAFKKVCERLHSQGLIVEQASPLLMNGDELPVAWVLQATKSA